MTWLVRLLWWNQVVHAIFATVTVAMLLAVLLY